MMQRNAIASISPHPSFRMAMILNTISKGNSMKKILTITFLLFAVNVSAQNIINTLGSGGAFSIKDNAKTFFSLSQSNGGIDLSYNFSTYEGVLSLAGTRFLYAFTSYNGAIPNTFLGLNSGNLTFDAVANTGIGASALFSLADGSYNTALGANALNLLDNGQYNTAIGYGAMMNSSSQGELVQAQVIRNVSIGYLSGTDVYGSNNTIVGTMAGNSRMYNLANVTLIGYDAEPSGDASNEITLGNSSVTSLRCKVTSITSLSDARDKKNIKDMDLGLDFIMKLRPRVYHWDRRDWYDNGKNDGSKMSATPTAGFIAQELDSLQMSEHVEWLDLVLKTNPDKLEATPGNLFPVVVKAVQDLKRENTELKNRIAVLEQFQEKFIKLISQFSDKDKTNEVVSLAGRKQ